MAGYSSQFSNDSSYEAVKRETSHRIFVNRSLQLGKIKYFGFDMDYTLAQYKSPEYEKLSFQLILQKLVQSGYPNDILKFEYDHTVPIRGLWFDKDKGFMLKVDTTGNILSCLFGLEFIPANELRNYYDNKFVFFSSRFYVYDTLFNLPEIYCLASVIEFFKSAPACKREKNGFTYNDAFVSFRSLFSDVRAATNFIHDAGELKTITVEKISDFVSKDDSLPELLQQLRANGAKVFLLTNSNFSYSDKIMQHLLGSDWRESFDYVIVDARKPAFFADSAPLKMVDPLTGQMKLGHPCGALQKGVVYSGGSCAEVSKLIGCRGKDVLYVGDHIFGDIVKSKKVGWRTLLIVPELVNELFVWKKEQHLFDQLQSLEVELSRIYQNCSMLASCHNPNDSAGLALSVQQYRRRIRETIANMDACYGFMGSLFRYGGRPTSFSSQVERYADLYAHCVSNLLYYPSNYMFRAPPKLMPHEATVSRQQSPPQIDAAATGAAIAMRANVSASLSKRKNSAPNIDDIQQVAKSHSASEGNRTSEQQQQQAAAAAEADESVEDEDSAAAAAAAAAASLANTLHNVDLNGAAYD